MSKAKINNAHVATMQGQLRSLILKWARAGYDNASMFAALNIKSSAVIDDALRTAFFLQGCGHKKAGRKSKAVDDDISENDSNGEA